MKQLALPVFVALLAAARLATAGTIALDLTGAGSAATDSSGATFTLGWAFDVLQPVAVDGLGVWDEGSDGLNESHLVRLWNSDGSILLASATIDNGSAPVASALPQGRWLFDSLAPVALSPGRYVIGADGRFNLDVARLAQGITTIGAINFVEDRQIAPPGFPPIEILGDSPGIFGPDLSLGPSVPGLSSAALLVLGVASLLGCARWRKRGAEGLTAR